MAGVAIDAVRNAGAVEVFTVGGPDRHFGVHHIGDLYPGQGPLGGLLTACAATEQRVVVLLACDLPGLDASVVTDLMTALGGHDAVVGFSDRVEPLCAAYRVPAVVPVATELFAAGERSMNSLLERVAWMPVPLPGRNLINVNSADDHVAFLSMIPEISVEELAERLAAGAIVFDVREPDEYEEMRVPGAIPIPLGTVPTRVDDFPADGDVLVICRSGGRSMKACEFLATNGRSAVNVAGGTLAWVAAGFDIASGPGAS
jgi:rhodanese-related sulfurtransferase/molybdopterin-guanine dinucleotide biosynthesis protein A